jgi:hypothetical protein
MERPVGVKRLGLHAGYSCAVGTVCPEQADLNIWGSWMVVVVVGTIVGRTRTRRAQWRERARGQSIRRRVRIGQQKR